MRPTLLHKRDGRPICADARLEADYFDLRTVHSNEVLVVTKPWPLQAFWPLQALVALLQALWPLQALAPVQGTWAWAAVAKLLTAKMAAAVTNIVRLVMNYL